MWYNKINSNRNDRVIKMTKMPNDLYLRIAYAIGMWDGDKNNCNFEDADINEAITFVNNILRYYNMKANCEDIMNILRCL